jgi:hypothetical protein
MKTLIVLGLLLSFVFFFQVSAQTLLVNDKIPDDLLIALKRQDGYGRNYSEMTINANGEFSFQNRPTFPNKVPTEVFILGERIKNPKYLKPKLPPEKLRQLIAEFEKIEFFKFGKEFPPEDEKKILCDTHHGTDIISIHLNGQIKEVSNNQGCSEKRNRLLRGLAEKIRGAGIWNYENGEIPEVFEIWYRVNDTSRIERDFRISGEGKIVERLFWEIDAKSGQKLYAPYPLKTKTVGRLSKQQLKELMNEFEKAVFSTFKYSILTKYAGCANEAALNEHKRTHINVQINHIAQMYGSLYKDCNPLPETDVRLLQSQTTIGL